MQQKQRYLEALLLEANLRKQELANEPIRTLYLGGGTPSQLSTANLQALFEGLAAVFNLSQCEEITLEANPDDMTESYVKGLTHLPINRISMGVQSFDAADLQFLNRRHTPEQAREAVARCQDHGFENLSIDLIYGLPNQTPAAWQRHLDTLIRLQIPHVSAYHLIYEQGTALHRLLEAGKVSAVSEETSLLLFELLINTLKQAGYEQYEISNFAKSGQYSKHNTAYWQETPYLGLGASAHSFDGKTRRSNVSSLMSYMKGYESGKPIIETEILDANMRYNDYIITGLRTQWGIDLQTIASRWGAERATYCERLAAPYLVQKMLLKEGNKLRLTEKGVFISDGIMSDLLFIQ